VIIVLNNQRAPDTMHDLRDRGFALSTVQAKSGAQFNIAKRIPVLTNVVVLRKKRDPKK
jgi:hypothetical protein